MIGRWSRAGAIFFLLGISASGALAQSSPGDKNSTWKPVQFAILRFNEDAPKDWNIYHTGKRGVLLVRLWKRYLLVDVPEEEVYDIDPQKVKPAGQNVELSAADIPDKPSETSEWKVRDVGPVERVRFRFGQQGHFLEIQLPLQANRKPAY
jgi:hypothetical protein